MDEPEATMFVPATFVVPTSFVGNGVRLVPLGPEHNAADYAAWTSSIDHIRATPGYPDGNWPVPMTEAENLRDLQRHRADFEARRGFTYTVLEPGRHGDRVRLHLSVDPSRLRRRCSIVGASRPRPSRPAALRSRVELAGGRMAVPSRRVRAAAHRIASRTRSSDRSEVRMSTRPLRQYYEPVTASVPDAVCDVAPWLHHRERLLDELRALTDAEWRAPTRCAAWDVKGVVSHLVTVDQYWVFALGAAVTDQRADHVARALRSRDGYRRPGRDAARRSERGAPRPIRGGNARRSLHESSRSPRPTGTPSANRRSGTSRRGCSSGTRSGIRGCTNATSSNRWVAPHRSSRTSCSRSRASAFCSPGSRAGSSATPRQPGPGWSRRSTSDSGSTNCRTRRCGCATTPARGST